MWTLLLSWSLSLVWPSAVRAATDPTPLEPALVAQGVLDPRLGLGHYHLQRQGELVTATMVAVRFQWPQKPRPVLFTVPAGFRPIQTVQGSIRAARLEGEMATGALGIQVAPSGAVTLTTDNSLGVTDLVRYASTLTWTTAEPYLWLAGWHPRGVYRLERRGSEVMFTVAATSVKTLASRDPRLLFRVPAGLRPTTTVAWQVTQSGIPHYVFEVTPNGMVRYWKHPLVPSGRFGLENYETTVRWHTSDPPRLATTGAYLQQPGPGSGVYQLQRQGEEVTLTLATWAAPVPSWVRPDLHRPPTLRIHPSTGIHPVPPPNVYVDPTPVWWPEHPLVTRLEPGTPTRYPVLGRNEISANPYSYAVMLPPHYWQIRLPDGRTGWIYQLATEVQGDVRNVPLTDRLFDVPPGFQPAQLVTWVVDAQPVEATGRPLAAPTVPLPLQVDHRVRYGPEMGATVPGYYRYVTQERWTVGTDVCQRSWPVQSAILEAVAAQLHRDKPLCEAISWADLAALRSLTISLSRYKSPEFFDVPGDKPHQNSWPRTFDLGGLTGLQELKLLDEAVWYSQFERHPFEPLTLPPHFLAHTPRLHSLELARVRGVGPEFLVHTPQLRTLTMALGSDPALSGPATGPVPALELPSGFLAYTPQLQTLHLDLRDIKTLPPGFLGYTPQLQELVLEAQDLTHLPAHFLAHAPQLRALRLKADALQYLPSGFLAHTPRLQTLVLEVGSLQSPDIWVFNDFLAHTSQLQTLVLNVGFRWSPPLDLLKRLPQLHTLWLSLTRQADPLPERRSALDESENGQVFPGHFLVDAPQLRTLHLHMPSRVRLPAGFLNSTPQLQELVLTADDLTHLPKEFLAHAPQLQCLTLPTRLRSSAWASVPECPAPAVPFGVDRTRPGFVPNLG
ncbi:MAG: hypothetical protein OXH72_02465 [Caldilineaceae bacterium]|nr:hypothetical protein [Caldilineaceae bacterium]